MCERTGTSLVNLLPLFLLTAVVRSHHKLLNCFQFQKRYTTWHGNFLLDTCNLFGHVELLVWFFESQPLYFCHTGGGNEGTLLDFLHWVPLTWMESVRVVKQIICEGRAEEQRYWLIYGKRECHSV